jgi:hypothetical protein
MKWIGQHIYDLVSRFREDVYLENLATTTETRVLVVDSDGKVSKTTSITGDITEVDLTAGTGIDLTSVSGATGGAYAATIGVDVSDFMSNGVDNRVLTARSADTFNAEQYLTFDGTRLAVVNPTTSSATQGGILKLVSDDGAALGDDHRLGVLAFQGAEDGANNWTTGAKIQAMADAAWSTSENGTRLEFYTNDADNSTSNILTLDSDQKATFTQTLVTDGSANDVSSPIAMLIDANYSGNVAQDSTGLHIDFDRTVPTGLTTAHRDVGIKVNATSASLGTSFVRGIDIDVIGTTSGTSTAYGIDIGVTGADTNYGIKVLSSHSQLQLLYDASNYAFFTVGSSGALEIGTIDGSATAADLTLDIDGKIVLQPADITGDVFHLDADADTDNIVNIDAGILDIDVAGAVTLDSSAGGISLDGVLDSNFTVRASGKDLDIAALSGGTQELRLSSDGTGASAMHLNATAGSVNIDSADAITIDAADEIVVTTTSADGHISLVSAHTAGDAFHLDADADVGSIVNIDAGILDIDVRGATTLDTDSFTVTSDAINFVSSAASDPKIVIKNTFTPDPGTDPDIYEPRLRLQNQRGVDGSETAGVIGDKCGRVDFYSFDDAGTPAENRYGFISVDITSPVAGAERGKMRFGIDSDGSNEYGIEILGSATSNVADVNIGFGTASVTTVAGNLVVTGSTTIKVLPHHFMSNEDGGANKSAQFRDDTIIGVRATADNAELYAFVEIPFGKTATSVIVYGNDTGNVVEVFESDINAGALTDKTHASGCVVDSACDITDVVADTTNYLVIKVTITSYTNDIVYGAAVTIANT